MPGSRAYAAVDPAKGAVSSFVGYLKGKSGLLTYEKYLELRDINIAIVSFGAAATT